MHGQDDWIKDQGAAFRGEVRNVGRLGGTRNSEAQQRQRLSSFRNAHLIRAWVALLKRPWLGAVTALRSGDKSSKLALAPEVTQALQGTNRSDRILKKNIHSNLNGSQPT